MRPLFLCASLALLGGCAATAAPAAAPSAVACGEAFAVSPHAWTVEGFGGADETIIVSQRRPMKRCARADEPTTIAAR